jgi:hypothetical protein
MSSSGLRLAAATLAFVRLFAAPASAQLLAHKDLTASSP